VAALLARFDLAQRPLMDSGALRIDEAPQVEWIAAHFSLSYSTRNMIQARR
jgi:hypothetical protein